MATIDRMTILTKQLKYLAMERGSGVHDLKVVFDRVTLSSLTSLLFSNPFQAYLSRLVSGS